MKTEQFELDWILTLLADIPQSEDIKVEVKIHHYSINAAKVELEKQPKVVDEMIEK